MSSRPSVLCPIDFSEASRASLGYAAAIAGHFGAVLTVLAVDDPLLAEAAATTGRLPSLADETERELRHFAGRTLEQAAETAMTTVFPLVVGAPAASILRVAAKTGADLIVMSSHGRSAFRKLFFGSTTERVLRETTVPVLITPDDRERVVSLSAMSRHGSVSWRRSTCRRRRRIRSPSPRDWHRRCRSRCCWHTSSSRSSSRSVWARSCRVSMPPGELSVKIG